MTLKDLHYISRIAAEKNMTKAAAKLFVAQPALSQCVQKVERELGTPVFIRTAAGVSLTAEGQRFLEFVNKMLYEEQQMKKEIEDIAHAERGEVRLGFTGSQAAHVLPQFLPRFREQCPHIDIILEEAASDKIEEMLAAGEIDVGILHPPILTPGLESFELIHDQMVIVPRRDSDYRKFIYREKEDGAGSGRPYLDIRFLEMEPVALTPGRQRSRMVTEQIFAKAGIIPRVKQVSRNLSTLDALAQADYATVILPEKQISAALKEREYFLIDERYGVPFGFFAALLQGSYVSLATQKMLLFLREEFNLT